MPAMKQSPEETVTGDLRLNNDWKTPALKVFEERESYGSYAEDTENYSRKSVVSRMKKWPAAVKDVNLDVFGRRIRNQIERIRAEDSHLGEDIGECLIAKVCVAGHGFEDTMIFSRPGSPLRGGKVAGSINSNR